MTIDAIEHARRTALFIATLAGAQLAGTARAEQFVLIDETFTFTQEDAQPNSHYYGSVLNPDRPVDWTSPVDYRNGSVHIRTEVIDKPEGSEVTQWILCYIAEAGQGDHYGCTGSGTYTEEGVYERDEDMHSWWQNDIIDWTRGINEMHLVMKDADGSLGFTSWRPDPEHFFPTTVRITMIQVSEGSTYDDSMFPDGAGEPDAGVDVDAGIVMDAGATGDDDDGVAPADDDGDGSDGPAGDGDGSGDGAGGSDQDEAMPAGEGAEIGGCSVGALGSAGRRLGVTLLGLFALGAAVRGKRRRRARQPRVRATSADDPAR